VFLGHVKNVVDILESSDILVHPTYHEGFGLSLVEAEMCGLPIIASNVGSIPEIVRDGFSGILVEPKSPAKLAEAIKLLAKNPKMRADMGKSGRQIFLDKFQLDKIAREKFIPLYEK
jgi:glycosyltransferase involved in cell wall biosynthesis